MRVQLYMLAIVLLFSAPSSFATTLIFSDTLESFTAGSVLTSSIYTPAVGGTDAASWAPFGPGPGSASVTAVPFGGSIAAQVDLPVGSGEEYLGRFFTTYTERILDFEWELTVATTNSGFGGSFIRLPTPSLDMQVLGGFLDDGRVVVFNDVPSPSSIQTIGAFVAGQTYRLRLHLDLPADSYTFYVDDVALASEVDIPTYLNRESVHQFGFDNSETLPTSSGNRYTFDNIRVHIDDAASVPESSSLVLAAIGSLLAWLATARWRRLQP